MLQYVLVIIFLLIINLNEGQHLGEKCQALNKAGACTTVADCPSVVQDFQNGIRPTLCGFQGNNPIVCCPIIIQSTGGTPKIGSKSQEKCEDLKKKLRRPQLGIVNGLPAAAGEFPHMVALGFGEENEIDWLCGGALISEKFVVTAAHCVYSQSGGPVKFALMGTINLRDLDKGGYPQLLSVINTFKHPDYKPPSTYNDIALLELNTTVILTPYTVPACLNTDLNITNVQAIGWGRVDYTADPTDFLMKVDLVVYNHTRCNNSYSNVAKRILQVGIMKDSQICAGGELNERKDTCQGDSGGPLHMPTDRKKLYTLIGVTSFGKGCGIVNVPGVYTKISHFLPWIESVVWR